jgi:hypothetical protein
LPVKLTTAAVPLSKPLTRSARNHELDGDRRTDESAGARTSVAIRDNADAKGSVESSTSVPSEQTTRRSPGGC